MEKGKDLNNYLVPAFKEEAALDFIESRDLETLEEGIKHLGTVSDLMGLVQGIAICKIEMEGLWADAGYPNLRAYRIAQLERLQLPYATLSNRRMMGTVWLTWGKYLGKMNLAGHTRKLLFLDAAYKRHGDRRLVLERFKKDTVLAFESWAKGPRKLTDSGLPDVDLTIDGDAVLLDGQEVLEMEESLPEEEKTFLANLLRAGYRARAGACIPHVVAVYDQGEARAIDTFLKKRRSAS